MRLCSLKHDQIAYVEGTCPCCALKDEVSELEQELSGRLADVDRLQKELTELREELAAAEQRIDPVIEGYNER